MTEAHRSEEERCEKCGGTRSGAAGDCPVCDRAARPLSESKLAAVARRLRERAKSSREAGWDGDAALDDQAASIIEPIPIHRDLTGKTRETPHCPSCSCSTPEPRAELSHDSPDGQFAAVLHEAEKGRPVNGQDLINALWWRVRNQRREISRLHERLKVKS